MPALLHVVDVPFEKATFGMGCFWACDSLYGATPGVIRTRVGYSGGTMPNPSYRNIGDHTEVIEIDFDPSAVTYKDLLKLFWDHHEYGLTTKVKRQYMSLILYHNEEQKQAALEDYKRVEQNKNVKLITEIAPAGPFYSAEDYHQKYRLQQHRSLCKELELTPDLLQTSHLAARLNGYLIGLGKKEDFEKDIKNLGLVGKLADYVRKEYQENYGGNLSC